MVQLLLELICNAVYTGAPVLLGWLCVCVISIASTCLQHATSFPQVINLAATFDM